MANPAIAPSSIPAPDLDELKTKQQAAWSSGNYAIVGSTLQIVGVGEGLGAALEANSAPNGFARCPLLPVARPAPLLRLP